MLSAGPVHMSRRGTIRAIYHLLHNAFIMNELPGHTTYGLHNFRRLPQIAALSEDERFAIEVVGNVFPFKVNNYVVEHLIDWARVPDDPMFMLTFPQRNMLSPENFRLMADALRAGGTRDHIRHVANQIRAELNPHPAGQMELNVPQIDGVRLPGMQHKYRETLLFFPQQGQTCHAYCTFCFRWPQFVGIQELKFAMKEVEYMVRYLHAHPQISDVLFTGGDPMIMSHTRLAHYIRPLLAVPSIRQIRIGSKSLGYWPYRFTTDRDADEVLRLFEEVRAAGKHLAFMAHVNHRRELLSPVVREAVQRIRATGACIRTQSPVMRHINDSHEAWRDMWREQVRLGMVPYYMFLARDTGAQDYFAVPLVRAWTIFQEAYKQVSGVCRTVRGPSMSAGPGKIQVLGPTEIMGEKVLALRFLQGRNPDWVHRPFFARYDEAAIWLDDLRPAFGRSFFFFEAEYRAMYAAQAQPPMHSQAIHP
ncbi:MAG: KamA family radical SAM protein [Bacteroidia bacterium]